MKKAIKYTLISLFLLVLFLMTSCTQEQINSYVPKPGENGYERYVHKGLVGQKLTDINGCSYLGARVVSDAGGYGIQLVKDQGSCTNKLGTNEQ